MTHQEILQPPSMDLRTLRGYCELIGERAGLSYTLDSQSLLEKRLISRVRERGLGSFSEYLSLISRDAAELDEVFEILTTKETYFFRQDYQLHAFIDEVLPLIIESGGALSRLTVWSAGCSTGEEAYTLAMLLSEAPLLQGWRVRVIGTDLCPSNIERARAGRYRASAFRTTTEAQLEKFFQPDGTSYRVKEFIRRKVHFSVGNLTSHASVRSVGRLDVIFCRNVLIYFKEGARRATTELFYERLLPGGHLFLGHSESLLHVDTKFVPIQLEGDLVYRRPPLEGGSIKKMGYF